MYEFLRNRELNSNTFFNNRAGVGRPPFVQNQYGVAGQRPHHQGQALHHGQLGRLPAARGQIPGAERSHRGHATGDFSNLRGANGALIPIYDPNTVCGSLGNAACGKDATGNDVVLRQPFPGNVIPSNRLNPGSVAYQKSWGLPNTTGAAFTNVNNFLANPSAGANADWLTFRGDYNISPKQRLFGRYSLWKSLTLEIDPFGTHAYPGELVQGSPEDFKTQQAMLSDTYLFSANTILDVHVSMPAPVLQSRIDQLRLRSDATGLAVVHEQPGFGAIPARSKRAGPLQLHRQHRQPDSGPHRGSQHGRQRDPHRRTARAENGR